MEVNKKMTEIGVIPRDWIVISLSELGDWRGGGTPSKMNHDYWNGSIPWVSPKDFNGTSITTTEDYITQDAIDKSSTILVNENSILIVIRSGILRHKIPIASNTVKVAINQDIKALINSENSSSKYVMYALLGFSNSIKSNTVKTGTTVESIDLAAFKKYRIPFPKSIAEQTAIATALSDTDALITSLEKLIAKKRNIKQGAMQELLKPKKDWVKKTLHVLADNKKELFDDGDWIEAEHITDEGVRLIQTGNIGVGVYVEKEKRKYVYEKSYQSLKCKPLYEGDLLICRLAEPAGRACVLPNIGEDKVITSVDVTVFRPRKEIANRVYLANLFSTSKWFQIVNESVGGTTHKRISRSSLGKIEVSMPPILEQTRIAEIFTDMDSEIESLERKLEKYKLIKQGMMQELLTGKTRLV